MTMHAMRTLLTAAAVATLCSCAASSGVRVTPQAGQYAPVPVNNVHISSHPPQGKYVVLAQLSADAEINETPDHLLYRLKESAAKLGADYVMVTSVADKTYLTPQNLDGESGENPYIAFDRAWSSNASPDATGYNNVNSVGSPNYQREVITGQALKMTSGTNTPDKSKPSRLWQLQH